MDVVIVDSGCANITSVAMAVERGGGRAQVSRAPGEIKKASRVILPGVGAAPTAMRQLAEADLTNVLPTLNQPVLGICLGMQLMFEASQEQQTRCLGIFEGEVERMHARPGVRIPHMGWNSLRLVHRDDPILEGIDDGEYFYFVHSYSVTVTGNALAIAEHGKPFASIVRQNNFWGCQFHPERSGPAGTRIIQNFLKLPC